MEAKLKSIVNKNIYFLFLGGHKKEPSYDRLFAGKQRGNLWEVGRTISTFKIDFYKRTVATLHYQNILGTNKKKNIYF